MFSLAAEVLLGLVSLYWLATLLVSGASLASIRRPPPLGSPRERLASVSVVVPVRDEAPRIGQTVRGLLAQREIVLQLVVVDDRSSDGTAAILDEFARIDSRLEIVRVETLPDGWLGKCHACAQGAFRARNDWILFMDADIHIREDVIARAIHAARRAEADHLVLLPGLITRGVFAQGAVMGWMQCLFMYAPPVLINNDVGKVAIGVGAFNLLRTDVYRKTGGYELLRMEVLDDVNLGRLVRKDGFRQRIYDGAQLIEADWARGVLDIIRGMEKNWFASVGYNPWAGIAIIASLVLVSTVPLFGPWIHPRWGWLALGLWFSPVAPALYQAHAMGWSWCAALCSPLGFPLFAVTGIRSMLRTYAQGGIRWRGTFYPLVRLRAERYRPGTSR